MLRITQQHPALLTGATHDTRSLPAAPSNDEAPRPTFSLHEGTQAAGFSDITQCVLRPKAVEHERPLQPPPNVIAQFVQCARDCPGIHRQRSDNVADSRAQLTMHHHLGRRCASSEQGLVEPVALRAPENGKSESRSGRLKCRPPGT